MSLLPVSHVQASIVIIPLKPDCTVSDNDDVINIEMSPMLPVLLPAFDMPIACQRTCSHIQLTPCHIGLIYDEGKISPVWGTEGRYS